MMWIFQTWFLMIFITLYNQYCSTDQLKQTTRFQSQIPLRFDSITNPNKAMVNSHPVGNMGSLLSTTRDWDTVLLASLMSLLLTCADNSLLAVLFSTLNELLTSLAGSLPMAEADRGVIKTMPINADTMTFFNISLTFQWT